MFEQQLFESENAIQPELEADGLFGQYEIKTWELSPRLYKIVAASTIANVLALLVFAQTSVLTMKGCDSPLVGSVCQALDTVYVGAMLFGTDREYVDAEYDKTELGDAEITYIDVTGVTPPLSYPEGYFQIANPVQWEMAQQQAMFNEPGMLAPGIPAGFPPTTPMQRPQMGGSLLDTKPNPPKPKSNVIDGDLPDSVDDAVVAGTTKRPPGGKKPVTDVPQRNPDGSIPGIPGSGRTNPTIDPNAQAGTENKDEAAPDQYGVYINKRPLKVKAPDALKQIEDAAVKIDSPFKVTISATLGLAKDGKTIVLKNPQPILADTSKDNPEMVKFVQEWIIAVGDAGWFGYFTRLDPKPKNLVITVEQNDTELIANVKADQPTENQASVQASSLSLLLTGARLVSKGDELAFLEKASVKSDGKSFVLNFKIPKPEVQEMVLRKLAESKDKASKPEGNAFDKANNNTAEK